MSAWWRRIIGGGPGARSLVYHHIAGGSGLGALSESKIAIPFDLFRRHLDYLSSRHKVVSLAEQWAQLSSSEVEDTVSITFDDGYSSVLEIAMPELTKRGIPFAIFFNGNPLLRGRQVPRVLLSLLLDGPHRESLCETFSREYGGSASPEAVFRAYKEAFHPAMDELIFSFADRAPPLPSPFASLAEVIMALRNPLLTAGSHTFSHPVLSRLGAEAQEREILECHRELETAIGRTLGFFAYPYGGKAHFNSLSEQVAGRGDFVACSAYGGVNRRANRTNFERIPTGHETPQELAALLAR